MSASEKTVKGVRVNCEGDHSKCHRPKYEPIQVPLTDPIFKGHDTSDIAQRIGIPLFTRKYPPNPIWEGQGSSASSTEAAFLHLSCDPDQESDLDGTGAYGFGWAPAKWQNSPGSILVVRQDKKPIEPSHVEALCKYCFEHAGPLLSHSQGEYFPDEPLSKEAALSMICRPTFSIFWYQRFVKEKYREGGSCAQLRDLYGD
ncbi:hypothetical protein TWF730_010487 [Orbilia blumenaviensis]|uniref:Uncharacterized protein n=1 Tax=Orbilia blumenaviensis TaxID=1796055 RepID=A0AAV9UQX6_9PEZI